MVSVVWVGHDRPGGKTNSVLGTLTYYPLRIRVQAEQPQHGCFGGNNGFRNQADHRLRVGWSAERHCYEGVRAFHNGVVGEILLIPWLRKSHIHLDSKQAARHDQGQVFLQRSVMHLPPTHPQMAMLALTVLSVTGSIILSNSVRKIHG